MFLPQSYIGTKPPFGTPINFSHPLARGLIGYWLFNEGCGKEIFDCSRNGNIGTINGAIWVLGPDGWALECDEIDDNVSMSDSGLPFGSSDRTVVFWFKTTRSQAGTVYLLSYGTGAANQVYAVGLGKSSGAADKLTFTPGGAPGTFQNNTGNMNNGNWHHCAIVSKNNVQKFLIDGFPDGTNAHALNTALGGIMYLNAYINGAIVTGGTFGDVYIYNRALSDIEVLQLYLNPYAMFETRISPAIFGALVAAGVVPFRRRIEGY